MSKASSSHRHTCTQGGGEGCRYTSPPLGKRFYMTSALDVKSVDFLPIFRQNIQFFDFFPLNPPPACTLVGRVEVKQNKQRFIKDLVSKGGAVPIT